MLRDTEKMTPPNPWVGISNLEIPHKDIKTDPTGTFENSLSHGIHA